MTVEPSEPSSALADGHFSKELGLVGKRILVDDHRFGRREFRVVSFNQVDRQHDLEPAGGGGSQRLLLDHVTWELVASEAPLPFSEEAQHELPSGEGVTCANCGMLHPGLSSLNQKCDQCQHMVAHGLGRALQPTGMGTSRRLAPPGHFLEQLSCSDALDAGMEPSVGPASSMEIQRWIRRDVMPVAVSAV